ncbi:MAG: chitobiase/beta-hexosaminidase C-terminal domain-containing protein, partial [Paramuribaculum sp.]|nr:chitobiase/beta-hexosaminidase C-terminal domain-containing protein [Paramuribaculum sp.]
MTFSKGSNTSSSPKYYNTGTAVRLYPNNELDVKANGEEIIKIEFTFSSTGNTFGSVSSTPAGTYSESGTTGTWTGSGEIVTIKCGKTSGHARLSAITITVKSNGSGPVTTVAKPVFTPSDTSTAEAKDITISCATEGASIYYTLDDTEPTKESTLYTEPIHLTTTTTVKAIAYATINGEEVSSEVTTATYQIYLNAPKFSIEPGTYTEPQTLSLTAYNSAKIYYTIDGTDPTEESNLYTEPIAITTNTFIKAIAINGEVKSPVAEGYYIINASAQTATFNFTENTYGYQVSAGNTTYVVSKLTEGDVTINLAATVNATGEPAQEGQQWRFWNTSGTDHLRCSLNANNKNTMTFTCGQGRKITSIVFTYTSGASYQPKEIIASQGTMTGITNWEGAASDVELTFFKGSGTTQIRTITVSTIESSAPDFSEPGGNFYRAFQLALTTSIPGAKIYYTLNGTVPTEGSTLYTEPILISATTEGEQITVRAIAVYEDEDGNKCVSEMASATYTYSAPGAEVMSIKDFYEEALKNSGKAILINIPLAVSAISDKYLYVNDGWPQNKFNSIEIVKKGVNWTEYYQYGSLIPAGTVAELGWSEDGITPTLLLKNDVEESNMSVDKILTDTITGLELNSIININPEDYPNLVLKEGVDIEMLSKLVCIKDVKFAAATSNTVNQSFTGTTPDGEKITFTVR